MNEISSTSNQRVKLARKLQRKRQRERSGLCLLEGVRLVRDAWLAGATFDTLFVLPELLEAAKLAPLILDVERGGGSVFAVTDAVLAAASHTVSPQGIVALVALPASQTPVEPSLVLILDGVGDPGNVGTLLRSASAAGVELVLLGPQTADPFSPKALRAAMGAQFRLPLLICDGWDELVEHLDPAHRLYVAEPDAELAYDSVPWVEPSGLIIGSEALGPSQQARQVGRGIAVPMQNGTESLNAAMAGSIILFEAARQRRAARKLVANGCDELPG